jgi:multidrug resistance efflux pump
MNIFGWFTLNARVTRLEQQQMATQADLDALTAQVDQVAVDLAAAQTTLQAEIDSLSSANPSLDLTGLQAAVAPLDDAVKALGELKPTA